MYQVNYTRSYLPNASIQNVFRREIVYETGEGHLLRASHLTRAKIYFEFGHPHSVTSFGMNVSDVSRICVNGKWVTKHSHGILYQYYRGTMSLSDMCAQLTAWPCGSTPRPSSGTPPPASPINVPPNDISLDTLMSKLEAIENVLHNRRPDGQRPRTKKKGVRKTLKPIVFVSSSESNTESAIGGPTSEDSDFEAPEKEGSDAPTLAAPTTPEPDTSEKPATVIKPYDDTYDRMSIAYRRRGLKFLQALDLILVCTGTGDYAQRLYLQMHNAHDIILGSGYRMTRSREVQLTAMARIAEENGVVPALIRLWNLVPRATEGSTIVNSLTYDQLHFCCVHPPPAQDQ